MKLSKITMLILVILLASSCMLKYTKVAPYSFKVDEPKLNHFLDNNIKDSILGYCYFTEDSLKFNKYVLFICKHSVLKKKLSIIDSSFQIKSSETFGLVFNDSDMNIPSDSVLRLRNNLIPRGYRYFTLHVKFKDKLNERRIMYHLLPSVYKNLILIQDHVKIKNKDIVNLYRIKNEEKSIRQLIH